MMLELLEFVCKKLQENDIEYMLSGSLVMNIYAVPRMTRDIDIVININVTDTDKFISCFDSGFYFSKDTINEEISKKGFFNIIDNKTGYKVDFIIRKESEYRIEEFNRRKKSYEYGFEAWVVSVEDLVISKLIWIQNYESEKQKDDIRNLLNNPEIDINYLNNWILKLHLKTYSLIP